MKKEYPRITAKVLAKLSDKLGSFTTYYEKYDVDRCHNIENGTGFINKSLVNPGETFSVYKAVSPFSYEHGYLTAGAYENGLVVQRYGDGICKVATTLYNAAIRAEMKIVERHNHSMTIHYVPLSFLIFYLPSKSRISSSCVHCSIKPLSLSTSNTFSC